LIQAGLEDNFSNPRPPPERQRFTPGPGPVRAKQTDPGFDLIQDLAALFQDQITKGFL
jgi:hypothetical protein